MKKKHLAKKIMMAIFLLTIVSGCALGKKKAPDKMNSSEAVIQPQIQYQSEQKIDKQSESAEALQNIYFEFDKHELGPEALKQLSKTTAWLSSNPEAKISIEGHCDERGTVNYNNRLGLKRAESAKNYFIHSGIETERITVISFGKEKPVDIRHTDSAWTKNRRDEFKLVLN